VDDSLQRSLPVGHHPHVEPINQSKRQENKEMQHFRISGNQGFGKYCCVVGCQPDNDFG
jgi:hypothetical protein